MCPLLKVRKNVVGCFEVTEEICKGLKWVVQDEKVMNMGIQSVCKVDARDNFFYRTQTSWTDEHMLYSRFCPGPFIVFIDVHGDEM